MPPLPFNHFLGGNVTRAIDLSVVPLAKLEQIIQWMNRLFL